MNSINFKNIGLLKYALFLLLITTLSCHNDDDDNPPVDPVDQLPEATQTGAGTFGCLLDGEVFLPGNTPNNLDCVYQFVNGGYYFNVQSNRRKNGVDYQRIAIGTNRFQIYEGGIFPLKEDMPGNATGTYIYKRYIQNL